MAAIDFNKIHNVIDRMSLDSWKMYNSSVKAAKEEEQKKEKTDTDTLNVSERDNRLNSKISRLSDDISKTSTAYSGLKTIEGELDKLKGFSAKYQEGKMTADELSKAKEASMKAIDYIAASPENKNTFGNFTSEKLNLKEIDLTSKNAADTLGKASSKLNTTKESYENKIEALGKRLDSLEDKKALNRKADELISNAKYNISKNPVSALKAQGNLNFEAIYSLLNQ